ncbi:MAG TPA: PKD domain-containing protein [Gemmatimonadales bacterium]|nr:PKD domain-containing protein [Gemmatimonadales bacterium]
MRHSGILSLLAGVALVAACGDGGNGNGNEAPTAGFTYTCNALACTFTNASTDPDGAATIATYSWDFDDATPAVTTANATHTFAAAGTYTVTLTVTDNEGASDDASQDVTVSATANTNPTANFTFACSDLTCDFTDGSSDADGSIASRSWTFESGTPATSTTTNPADVAFPATGDYDVTLTVTDNQGGTGNVTKTVSVTAPAAGAPTASFDVTCSASTCTITNTSTNLTGAETWAWTFGDGQTSTDEDPAPVQYTVNDVTDFTITLVATNASGSSQATRVVTVSPAATLTCGEVGCTLLLDEASTVVVTLESADCEAHGNTFLITAPIEETLFEDGCFATVGTQFTLNGGAAFAADTELAAEVRSGLPGAQTPQLRVTGNFTDGWTLEFDDGFVGPGEPDFNDLVMTVKATPVP